MEGVKEFVGLVNKALPGAWEAAIRQAYIHGGLCMIGAVVCGVLAVGLYLKSGSYKEEDDEDGSFEAVMSLFLGLFTLFLFIFAVMFLGNPAYHAIQLLKP